MRGASVMICLEVAFAIDLYAGDYLPLIEEGLIEEFEMNSEP